MTLAIDTVLHDRYRIIRLLSEGGLGDLYEAVDARRDGRRFAVKVIEIYISPELGLPRFRRVAQIVSDLGHPNIAEAVETFHGEDGSPCIVTELLEGEGLAARLERTKRLPPVEVLRMSRQVASALAAAHARGVVHGDLKLENIFFLESPPNRVKVQDFGISKILDSVRPEPMTNTLLGIPFFMSSNQIGEPLYMAPEQVTEPPGPTCPSTDIFTLGAIIYRCLTGRAPFVAGSPLDLCRIICDTDPPPVTERVPGLPARVQEVVGRAMAKSMGVRFQQVDDFVDQLEHAFAG